MSDERLFDLNIEKILEAWEDAHAVRELIANALDEQILSSTADVEIFKRTDGAWIIQDHGRGLRYENFTQNENQEKLSHAGQVIGKFGVGLKDALATLHRSGVQVQIVSAFASIRLLETAKHGFDDVVTLHAVVGPPQDSTRTGTTVALTGLADAQMMKAKAFFLRFSDERQLEETPFGQILERKPGRPARVYVAGLLVAEEDNFAFSYNITSLTEPMRKALNRERTNVGRTAYADRVKKMLLEATSQGVATVLAEELRVLQAGSGSDEVGWKEISVHACRILNASGRYLFVAASQLVSNASAVGHARDEGLEVIVVSDAIQMAVADATDISGAPIRDLGRYQAEWNDSFVFDFVAPDALTMDERTVWNQKGAIAALAGGLPPKVAGLRISRTMRADFVTGADALGLWDPDTQSIVIRRDQLSDLAHFAGTLLHEILHAKTGFDDVTRDFEGALTELVGVVAAQAVKVPTIEAQPKGSMFNRMFTR